MRTVCIVDDQVIAQNAVRLILEETTNMVVIATFTSAEEFVNNYEALQPDVTVMDLDLPVMSGMEAIIIITTQYPKAKFLVLTNYDDDDRLFKSLKAGATGYLLKRQSYEFLPSAIESIYNGGAPMSPEIARKVISYFQRHSQSGIGKFQQLTEKETTVLKLLADGFLYKEIAEKLSVSMDTVKKTAQNIYEKLQVHTRSEAIRKYLTS